MRIHEKSMRPVARRHLLMRWKIIEHMRRGTYACDDT
jgi:hypothetical protein